MKRSIKFIKLLQGCAYTLLSIGKDPVRRDFRKRLQYKAPLPGGGVWYGQAIRAEDHFAKDDYINIQRARGVKAVIGRSAERLLDVLRDIQKFFGYRA